MNTETTTLPLWKELNEKRSSKEYIVRYSLNDKKTVNISDELGLPIANFENSFEAQYTALAVNNFAKVCEALEEMINAEFTDELVAATLKAKQVLNNIK